MALQISFPFGRLVDVFVTHVDESCGSFFVQVINEDEEKLNKLMQDIEQSVNDGTAQTVRSNDILVGGVYLAEFEDGGWYRARVLGLSPDEGKCEVFFIDYGNSDFVRLQNIRKANEQFLKLSPQAFECELNQLERSKGDSFSELKDKILEQELFCRAVSLKKNGTIVADLFTDPDGRSSVLDTVAGAGHSTSSSVTVPANTTRKDLKYKAVSVKLDSYQDVVVSHLGDPERFCCQLISHTEDLQTVMSQLTEEYSELSSDTLALKSCSLGRACCAKFADDEGWYRAMITGVGSVASGFVEVKFVDYGNSQKTPLTDVKEIKEELARLPAQAFECTLSGVAPAEGQWSDEAKSLFGKLTKEKHMVGLIGGQEADGRYQVKLYDTTSDSDLEVPNVLVAAGYAQKTSESMPPTPYATGVSVARFTARNANPAPSNPVYSLEKLNPGSSERVLVPAADNPTKFYCQLFRTSKNLEDLMKGVEIHYSGLRGDEGIISSPAVGDPCCAKFSEDNCWYRAEVINVDTAGKITVQFVDYGNSEVVARSNIRQLLPKFSELPRQAIECSLNRIRPKSQTWNRGDIKKFYDLAVEKEGKVEVIAEESSGVYRVELTRSTKTGNVNISEQLVAVNAAALLEGAVAATENLESMQNKEFTEVTVVIGNYEDVIVSHFEDPHNFWCQNVASSGELDTLMESIDKYYSGPGQKDVVRSPFLGMSCVASYSVDNGWYRGKVTGIKKGNQVEVQFVDYGNSEVMPLSNVKDVNREFIQLPAQAFKCALESISFDGMSWPQNALDKFNELTAEELVGRVDAFDKNKGAHLILLLNMLQGKNLNIGDEITALLPQDSQPSIPQLKLKSGDRESVVVTSVSGPNKIFCQVQRTANELDGLMLDIDSHYQALDEQQSRVDQSVVGGFYVAKYSVDQAWFRAKVTQVNPSSVEVYYVDYGNSETLPFSEVKQLVAKFAVLPAQCVECSLAGDTQGVSDEAFKELTLDMEFVAKVLSVRNSGVAEVELYSQDTNESLLDQLPKSAERKPVEKKPVSAGTFQHVTVPSLNIRPNTKEDVYVTTVESVEKTFCQLSKNVSELDKIMEEIEEYYRPLNQQQERLTSPSVGDWCVAKFSVDDGWYRAQISGIQGSSAEVLYIDYGNSETVSLADVKVLKPEFATVPAQAFSCSLAGCKASAALDAKFKEIALENEFIANIVSVQNNKVQVELVTKDTEKSVVSMLQPEDARSEVSESVTVANLGIDPGTKELATITAVESMTKFYCQLNKNTEALDQMMNSIDEYYAALDENQKCIDAPSVGDFCMATFSEDGGWYRARIMGIGSSVDVFYIDYGNSESLPVKSIKKLHPQFASLPAQAIECCLKGASSSVDIFEKEFQTHFLSAGSNGAMEVNLILAATGEDVLSTLGASQTQSNNKGFKALSGLFVEEYADVCPVTVYGPHNFSCQVMNKQQIESLRQLMDSIQTHYNTLEPGQDMLQSPAAGMACCALFPEDNLWYRSIITGVPSEDTVDVTYVDYGNCETVALSDVRVLKAEFMKDPLQSIACSLANIKPVDGTCWPEAVVARFEALVLQKQLVAKIVKKDGNSMEVELFDTSDDNKDVNIGAQLVEEKFASPTHPQTTEQLAVVASAPQPATSNKLSKITKLSQLERTKPAASETVYVTAVVSPVRFYCQIEGIEDKLQTLMDDLSMFYEVLAPEELTSKEWGVGDLCCAQFSEDELWYRAVVERVSAQETADVRFIDYGNGETKQLTAIKELKDDSTTVPPFAIECWLSGARPPNGSSWTPEAAATFEQLTEYKALTANFKNRAEPIEVELMEGSTNLIQKLQEAGVVAGEVAVAGQHATVDEAAVPLRSSPGRSKTKKLDYISPALKIGDEKKAFITCVTTPGLFFCQLSENTTGLDDLMNDLNDYCCQLDETEGCLISPVDGQPCVALFSTDGMWYRARVLSLTVNSVEVLFIDYGNTEVIKPKELKSMEPKYMKLPVQAIECSLDLSKQDWTVEHGTTLEHVTREEGGDGEVHEKEVSLKVIGQQDGRYEVKVLEGTTCISDNLLAQITGSQGAPVPAAARTSEASASEFSEIEVNAGVAKEGYVSYTISTQDFYIQLSETFPRLCEMMGEIAAVYSGSVDGVHVDSLKPGFPCVTLFANDGGWYRGTVKKILSDEDVEVEYVDYGNCARVPAGDVKPLYSKFADLPKQAIHCKLSSGKESFAANADQLFKKAVEDKSLTTVFTTLDNSIWTVTLSDEDVSITELLIVGAAAAVPLSEDTLQINEFVTEEIVEGLTERVYIAHVENPGEFYLQLVSSAAALDWLTAALTDGYSAMQPSDCLLISFDVGTSCCALFSLDGQWYRAVIKSVIDGEVTVHFIDYGNSETVKADQVKELKKEFMSLPRQAVQCSLDVAKDSWSSRECASFVKIVNDEEEFVAKFGTQVGNKWHVSLERNGASVLETLLPQDAGASETMLEVRKLDNLPITPGQTAEVYISHVNDPGNFFVQMSETTAVLEVLTSQIGGHYACLGPNDSSLEKCEVGSVCCVPFTEDNCFYRAIVKSISSDSQVEVEFVDFGNSDNVPLTSIKSLTPDLAKPPCQAVKCGLMDVKSNGTDEYTAVLEALFDKPLQATFVKQEESTWMVVVEHEGKCINKIEELQATGVSQAETKLSVDIPVNVEEREFAIVPVTPGQSAEVYLVHANDPSSFYVQFSESAADLDTVMAQIEGIYPSLGPIEESFDGITVNSLCCAQFEEDHQWYRAIVRNLSSDSMVEVEFVDYGNAQVVPLSSVKLLRKEFMKLPRQAIHCGMVNVKTHWTDEDIKVFRGILGEKPINASFICQEGATWLVQLDCEGVCVNDYEQFKKVSEIPGVENGVEKKEEKQEIVLNSYTEPVLGHREPVYLLSTESTDTLWLQVAITEEELETLMTNIANCSDLDKLESTQLREGLPCLGMFTEDDKLYRACVAEYNTESVHVRYVDYGNSEWVPLDRLRIIRDEFLQLPSQAFQCKLEGVKEVNGDQLFELCDQKLLEVETVSREPSGYYVLKLFDPDDDKLLNELVSAVKDVAPSAAESPSEVTTTSEERTFSHTEFKAGDSLTMFVTVVDSPNSLWCQLDDPENKLEQLMGEIDDYYSKLQNEEFLLQSPTPGAMCCGQYTADDVWYRAEVQEVCGDGNIAVHFVDYGNDEHLPQTRVKKLLEQFQVLPVQAVNCSLFGVDPVNGECWSEDANEKFHDLCSDKSLVGKIQTITNSVLEVELTDKEDTTGLSLNSQLIAAGLARESGEEKRGVDSVANEDLSSKLVYNLLNLSVGSKATVTVTNTLNPGQFWCQVTESSDKLLSLMEELEKYYTTTPELDLIMPSIGLPCCAKFAEDEQWYRAVISDVGTDIEVCYVDYGNTAKLPLSDIKIMNEQFLPLPVQALQCSLDGANPDADGIWQVDGTEYFQGLVHDQEMELSVVAAESGKYVITLSSASGVDLGTAMSGEVPLEVPPTTSIESSAVPDNEMSKQEATETKCEQESSTDESDMQPGPTENGAEEATAIDEQVMENLECHSEEDTQFESVEQEVAASPSTEEEIFEDTVEHVEATEEHAVPDDECTGESTNKIGDEEAEAERSGAYDEAVKPEALEDADDVAENEETKSSGSEEFLVARQDSSEEIAVTGTAEDIDGNGSAEFDVTDSHGLKSSAEELESHKKTESGGVLNAKDDDETFLDEVCQLVQSDGSSLTPLTGASDAGDDEMEDDSEDLVLSDEALETLNRELDQEEIGVVQPAEKPEEQLLPRGESVVTSEEMCKKENSEEISIGDGKPSENGIEEMCKKEHDEEVSTSDSKASEEMCKNENGERISTSDSKASEEMCKKDNGEEISTSDSKASEEMCKRDNGEEISTSDSKASEEMCKDSDEDISTGGCKVSKEMDNGEEISTGSGKTSEEYNDEAISTNDSKASEEMCKDSDEEISTGGCKVSEKMRKKDNGEEISTGNGKASEEMCKDNDEGISTSDSKASEEMCKDSDEEISTSGCKVSEEMRKKDNGEETSTGDGKASEEMRKKDNDEDISTDDLKASEEMSKQDNGEKVSNSDNIAFKEICKKDNDEEISTSDGTAAHKKEEEAFNEDISCEEGCSEEVDVPTPAIVRELNEEVLGENNVEMVRFEATDSYEEQVRQEVEFKESENNFNDQSEVLSGLVLGAEVLVGQGAQQADRDESTEEQDQIAADATTDGTESGLQGDEDASEGGEEWQLNLTKPDDAEEITEEEAECVAKLDEDSTPIVAVEAETQISKSEVASERSDEEQFCKADGNFAGETKELQDAPSLDTDDAIAITNELDVQQSSSDDDREEVTVDDQTKAVVTDMNEVPVDVFSKDRDFASPGDDVPELETVTAKEDLKTADNLLNVSELDDKDHTATTEDDAATCVKELTPEDRVVTLDAVSKINEDFDKLVGEENKSLVENQAEVREMDDSVTLSATNVPESERPVGETDSAVVETVSCDPEPDIVFPDEEAKEAKEVDVSESVSEESARPRDSLITDDGDAGEATVGSTVPDEEKPAYCAQQANGMMTNGHKEAEDESTMQDIALEDEVRVTAVTGDGHFWSHFSSLTNPAGLYELQESMNEYYGDTEKQESGTLTDHTWKEGDLCAALCTEENQWCRAEVTSVNTPSTPSKKKAGFLSRLLSKKSEDAEPSDGNCTVTLLDSGVQETVSLKALRPLDASFQDLPHQAKLCHLDAANDWAPQGVERLEELLAHQTFRAVIRKGVGDILTCQDVPLILFPSKDGDETTGYTENKVGKPTESINQKLQSEGLVQL